MSTVVQQPIGVWSGLRRYARTWFGLVLATILLDVAMAASYQISPTDVTRSLAQSLSVLTTTGCSGPCSRQ